MPYDGSDLDETTKILLEARRLVEEGWCQGAYEDAAGRVCLQRALYLGLASVSQVTVGMSAFDRVVKLLPPMPYARTTHPIEDWNDVRGRTQAEVLELLDRAIAGGEASDEA